MKSDLNRALLTRLLRGACAAAVPMLVGAAFYALCRPREAWFVGRALDAPGIGPSLRSARGAMLALTASVPPPALGWLVARALFRERRARSQRSAQPASLWLSA